MKWSLFMGMVAVCLFVFGGCTSISREAHFTPCSDRNCNLCHGTGTYKCPRCLGRGVEICSYCRGSGYATCNKCKGDGTKDGKACKNCNGTGRSQCYMCKGMRTTKCSKCGGDGVIRCGETSYTWVCRKCGRRFDYPAKLCLDCDKKK